jgi:hypothetical protein
VPSEDIHMELTRAVLANRIGEHREPERKMQARPWLLPATTLCERVTETRGPPKGRRNRRRSARQL